MAVRLGLGLPQYGRFADPDALVTVAREAEARGFTSLWVGDRLLTPLEPRDRYPGGNGTIPHAHRTFLDPFTVLATAAAVTSRIRLGTSTLNANWYPPALLARSLTTIDRLSSGRLEVGLGLGWSSDEYAAAGIPWEGRAARFDAVLDALETIWRDDPVSLTDRRWSVAPSHILPKPAQSPRPPVHLAGFSPAALARVGRRADGWLAVAMPVPVLTARWGTIRESAERNGRDPDEVRVIVRVNPIVAGSPAADAPPGGRTVEEIAEHLGATAETGVHEMFLDLQQTARDPAHLLDLAEALRKASGL
ncbi:TIGR03619 family F420-dependent LLM class oxidoreductase [Streptosporangium sp. NBC_01756]|uniref:TIGR03619 family F420-dependent LLM class oxidoreductase n=1 Tax=Streptosporangium sp. NBC_01756 TaxID=2975950 RepID=UPI002DDBA048|nr:TIGR03619 family F420-dependent LLM class oxidoreductase [Streptosporangium sp. NBC_01756]WSC87967.1 TIGR03619 family F420-dependent LLM class oxidoreductase [Streptosporangium sp. NBC_01756]